MIAIGLVWALGCAGADGDSPDTAAQAPSLGLDLQPLFDRSCVGSCHDATSRSGGLVLTADGAYAALVRAPSTQVPALLRVAPGDPESSYLVNKIEGTHASAGGEGTTMPPGFVLSTAEVALVRAWIQAGAAG